MKVLVYAGLVCSATVVGQVEKGTIPIAGFITDLETHCPLSEVTTVMVVNGDTVSTRACDADGEYGFGIVDDKVSTISFSKKGYVSTWYVIDLTGTPDRFDPNSYGLIIDLVMIQILDGVSYDSILLPIGLGAYSSAIDNIDWDMDYTRDFIARRDEVIVAQSKARVGTPIGKPCKEKYRHPKSMPRSWRAPRSVR